MSVELIEQATAAVKRLAGGDWEATREQGNEFWGVYSGSVWGRRVAGLIASQREAEFIAAAPELVAQLTRALKSVDALASRWESATSLTDGQPNIVARAFADDLRRVLVVAS